jgi:uncharacterized membrane protein YfcA
VTWQFTLSGFLIGALVGMTGMGGGSLLTPILDYGSAESIEAYAVGVALVIGGVGLVAKTFIRAGIQPSDAPFLLTRRDRVIAVAMGATCGFVVGLTSVGSGTFFGLIMVLVFPLTVAKIVGTDIFHAALLLWVAGFGHLVAGNVDLHAMAWLLTGSIPGVLLTSQFALKVPDNALRLGLASVLMLSGIKLVDFSGADYVIVGGALAAGLGFAVWAFVARLGSRRADLGMAPASRE